jgi:hypothetical protein
VLTILNERNLQTQWCTMKLPRSPIPFSVILLLALTSITEAIEPMPLRAGPFTMVFDADNVFLRYQQT